MTCSRFARSAAPIFPTASMRWPPSPPIRSGTMSGPASLPAARLGFASHSPGGLGVFDAAMLVGLWQMDREDLLAGMLLFRVLYYISPFVISVILLTFREVIVGARQKRLRQAMSGPDAAPR